MGEIYSEVYDILNLLGESYIERLPKKLYNLILDSKDNDYKKKFNTLEDISIDNCSKDAMYMIALFHLNYWCENEEEKEHLNKILADNYQKNEQIKKEKYDVNNIFKKAKDEVNTKEIIEYKPKNMIEKIFLFIKNIFKRK